MRLTCPNCDAQYEIPDDVMPENGRDVQCSNCGTTWFQAHPNAIDVNDELEDDGDDEIVQTKAPAARRAEPEFDDLDADELEDEPDDEPDTVDEEEEEDVAPARRPLSSNVADILKQEAEMEARARRGASAGAMESQPDLGLQDINTAQEAAKRSRDAQDRMARMRGEDLDEGTLDEDDTNVATNSRRGLLPDIEEINSTLRSSSDRTADGDPTELANAEVREKRGFRRGFAVMVVLFALLALLYVAAPALAKAVPTLDPFLTTYVATVDTWRMWLNGQMTALLEWVNAAASGAS